MLCFFFKQKTAYDMRISDWSSDVCSSDLILTGLLEVGRMTRTAVGMGYDVHRLVAGKPLWIGGIEIAHSHGLEGHSDADVALHAITDAILGALADGDIGDHFPPSDPQWRGAASQDRKSTRLNSSH